MRQRGRSGFTLFEMLTVIAVLAIVTTIGMRLFFRVTDLWKTTAVRMELNTKADTIFDLMGHDFSQILSSELSGVPLVGQAAMEEVKRYKRVRLEDDRIILPIEYQNPLIGRTERVSVMYHIERDEGAPKLMRTLDALGKNPPEGTKQLVAENVLSMRIEYGDGKAWLPAWARPEMPDAVRLSLVLTGADRSYEQIARRTVFAIRVK